MKLIDTEKAIAYAESLAEDGIIDDERQFIDILRDCPVVEAIPVEWIEKWLDEFLEVKQGEETTHLDEFKKTVYQGIFLMYNEWRRSDGK